MTPFDAYSETYQELISSIDRQVSSHGISTVNAFVEEYSKIAADSGDAPDLFPTEIYREGNTGYQINAYNFDIETGEVTFAVADTEIVDGLATFNRLHADKYIKRVLRFFNNCKKRNFIDNLEESSDAYELAAHLHANMKFVKRVRVIFFSKGVSTIKKPLDFDHADGIDFSRNVFDIVRYHNILSNLSISEDYEITFDDYGVASIPLLPASITDGYQSYMAVMPGDLLAKIYSLFGGKLLEQNVRVFLQARTKVNRGIISTIENSPDHFFAYNNGLTVTASEITTTEINGVHHLTKAKNLQIVNGGQTTASILYARDKNKSDLAAVSVQMKLNVTSSDAESDLVKNISRYSNTQNAVREADFFSTHPFHVYMEKTSLRVETPRQANTGNRTKWFYERARGQYKDRQAYMTPKKRQDFIAEFPKSQLFDKTSVAKYYMSVSLKPYLVSQGAQKCFLEFANLISKQWQQSQETFNDDTFREFVAKAILFTETDKAIASSYWYKENRGYKAEIATYTVACIADAILRKQRAIDYNKIWNQQGFTTDQLREIVKIAEDVRKVIVNPPTTTSNIREYCKKAICWDTIRKLNLADEFDLFNSWTLPKEDAKIWRTEAKKQGKVDLELKFDIFLQEFLISKQVDATIKRARDASLLTPNGASGLRKLQRGATSLNYAEKDAIKKIFQGLDIEYLG